MALLTITLLQASGWGDVVLVGIGGVLLIFITLYLWGMDYAGGCCLFTDLFLGISLVGAFVLAFGCSIIVSVLHVSPTCG